MRRGILLGLIVVVGIGLLAASILTRGDPPVPPAKPPSPGPGEEWGSFPLAGSDPGRLLAPTPAAAPRAGAGEAGAGVGAATPPPEAARLQALVAATTADLGAILAEYGDIRAFLAAAPGPEWKFTALSPEDRRRLFGLLDSPDPELRFHVALALARVELEPEEVARLGRAFDAEWEGMSDEKTRNAVLALSFALAKHGDTHGTATLADALRTGAGAEVKGFRSSAALVLGITGGEEGVPALVEVLATDPERDVRKVAAQSLGRIGGTDSRDALTAALTREEDVEVRAWAALSAARAGAPGAGDPELLVALGTDPADEVRGAAAFGLSRTGGEGTVERLTEAYYADSSPYTRIGAVAGVVSRGAGTETADFLEHEASPWLEETVRSAEDAGARYYAAVTLGFLGASESRAAALRDVVAKDPSPWVRIVGVQALADTAGAAAVPFLEARLAAEENRHVRDRIEQSLRRLGGD